MNSRSIDFYATPAGPWLARNGGTTRAAVGIDAQGVVDIGLAILGSSPERFAQYNADVRREYDWVPGFRYRRARRAVLQGFLGRPRIYTTDSAFELLEAQARTNLIGALERLAQ